MIWAELNKMFMLSRKRGTDGAYKKCGGAALYIYQKNLDYFFNFMVEHEVATYADTRKADLLAYYDWLDAKDWSKSTRLQNLRCLRTFLRWVTIDEECVEGRLKDWTHTLPAIEDTPQRAYIPSRDDLRKFKATFNTRHHWDFRNYVIFCMLLGTGIRVGELCTLTLDNLMLGDKLMQVKGKSAAMNVEDARTVALTDDLVRLLEQWLKHRKRYTRSKESPFVFVSKRGQKCTPNGVAQVFRKKQAKHGLPDITPHTLRHAFCTYYLRRNGSMERLRGMTGHKSYRVLGKYVHAAQIGTQESIAELERASPLAYVENRV